MRKALLTQDILTKLAQIHQWEKSNDIEFYNIDQFSRSPGTYNYENPLSALYSEPMINIIGRTNIIIGFGDLDLLFKELNGVRSVKN